jgi:lipoate synthase
LIVLIHALLPQVLPEDLADAIRQAALATAEAIKAGNTRTQVEILLPEFWDPISGQQG